MNKNKTWEPNKKKPTAWAQTNRGKKKKEHKKRKINVEKDVPKSKKMPFLTIQLILSNPEKYWADFPQHW